MIKRGLIFLIGFIFTVSFIAGAYALSCFPEYECGEWQGCIEDIELRICKDKKCGDSDITERRLCKSGCTSDFQCSEWTQCKYAESFKDVFSRGEVALFGKSERRCVDVEGCAPSYNETALCRAVNAGSVKFSETVVCDKEYLTGLSKSSNRPVFNINLDSFKQGRFDISFVQAEQGDSCPGCFNGIKDNGEEGIDCGKSCGNTCKLDVFYYKDFALFFWILSFFLFVLLLSNIVSFNLGVYRIRLLLALGEVFLGIGSVKKAASNYSNIRQVYYDLDDKERALVKKEIYEHYSQIKSKSRVR